MKSIDFYRHFSLHIDTFKLFGIWFYIPHPVKSVKFWAAIFMKIVVGILFLVIPTAAQLIHVIKSAINADAEVPKIAENVNLVMTEVLVSLRLLDLFLRRKILTQLVDQLMCKEFQFYLKPQQVILENGISLSRKLFWALIISVSADILVHVILVPGLKKFEVLPLQVDLIWIDINDDSYFVYAYVCQVIYKPMSMASFVALQTLPWAAMCFAISQLDVLIYNFENMEDLMKNTMAEKQCNSKTAFKEVLKECVLHHCSLVRYIKTLQNAFGGQFISTLCLSSAVICTTAMQIFSMTSPKSQISELIWILAYFSIFICDLFIDCYFGNAITVRGLHLSTVIYNSPWIEMPTSLKKNLVLFLAKTQQPIVITAAVFIPISLDTFTKVMNWTYQAYAVMNQMQK